MTIMEGERCKRCGKRLTILDGEKLCRQCDAEQQIRYLSIGYTIAAIGVAVIGFLISR
jgi:transposase-like protein